MPASIATEAEVDTGPDAGDMEDSSTATAREETFLKETIIAVTCVEERRCRQLC
jgi:hypothetical protein